MTRSSVHAWNGTFRRKYLSGFIVFVALEVN